MAAPGSDRTLRGGWVLGIDEAGRGSVVGPLVVGGFLVRTEVAAGLPDLDVKDSKLLTPKRRRAAYERLRNVGHRHRVVLTPADVDVAVREGKLNDLEARAFATLVRRTRPETAFVDACDPVAARFGRTVARYAGTGTRIEARHKADRDLPVVGAASIVAKVVRDEALERLRGRLGPGLGSGYPSDRKTRAFVAEVLARGERPPWLRASWQTTQDLLPAAAPRPLEAYR